MSQSFLDINLDAIVGNWRALDALSDASVETAAVVKADAYGCGAAVVGKALHKAGANSFFVALPSEGAVLRKALGAGPKIYVFSGLMAGDLDVIADADLIPTINSADQLMRYRTECADRPFGIQLDSGMNRLGMEPEEFGIVKEHARSADLIISHLACADDPDHPQNAQQLAAFHAMTDGMDARRSLSATGGTLLGAAYHFDMVRPGIGLHGAAPFDAGANTLRLSIPVIQSRLVKAGEAVGYGAAWMAEADTRIATVAAGYADGIIRALSFQPPALYSGDVPCPVVGRVSMDLITVDVSGLEALPESLDLICDHQRVDALADAAGTIGYEILTALGSRYERRYTGG
ncbi:MAG: alanine racemase [Pseudomonadota bacterium]